MSSTQRLLRLLAFLGSLSIFGCCMHSPSNNAVVVENFCRQWNPDYTYNGHRCCGFRPNETPKKHRKRQNFERRQASYCQEMTSEQSQYMVDAYSTRAEDPITLISESRKIGFEQAFCSVNDGFLAFGRNVVPTSKNHIFLRFPSRCTNFGTDAMVGMLEWMGRKIDSAYPYRRFPYVRLMVGDISAPRGGNLWGFSQRSTHRSHSNGQDADIGFFSVKSSGREPVSFRRDFDATKNWWLIKNIFTNPYACVRMTFLDRRLIARLGRVARRDPLWPEIKPFLIHAPGHFNHFHVRIGNVPGKPGCPFPAESDSREGDEESDIDNRI